MDLVYHGKGQKLTFGSKTEKLLYDLIKQKEGCKKAKLIGIHSQVALTDAKIAIRVSFKYRENGQITFAVCNPLSEIKNRLWLHYGPGPLHTYQLVEGKLKKTGELVPVGA